MCHDVYFRFETRYTHFSSLLRQMFTSASITLHKTHIYMYVYVDIGTYTIHWLCMYVNRRYVYIIIESKQHQLFATLWFGELSEHLSCGREIKYFMYGKIIFLLHIFARFIFVYSFNFQIKIHVEWCWCKEYLTKKNLWCYNGTPSEVTILFLNYECYCEWV